MRPHRHWPADGTIRLNVATCGVCGRSIVRINARPDRMAYWRAVRRVAGRSVRSVSPRPATVDNDGWSEAEMREAYGR